MLHHKKYVRGLTAIEMIVAVSVVAVIMVAVSDSAISLYRAQGTGVGAVAQVASARRASQLMIADFRQTSYGDNGSSFISSMGPYGITFFTENGGSGTALRIEYSITGSTLKRSYTIPGSPAMYAGAPSVSSIATNVQNLTESLPLFRYYDAAGTEIVDMNRVADVRKIALSVKTQSLVRNTPFTFSSVVTLRNLRDQ